MLKTNPHSCQYYGVIYQDKGKNKKLRRTQLSGQKMDLSKNSFSQDSQPDNELNLYNKRLKFQTGNKNKQKEFRRSYNAPLNPLQNPAGQNILEQFQLFRPLKQDCANMDLKSHAKGINRQVARVDCGNLFINNLNIKNIRNKHQLGQYFCDSLLIKNNRLDKNSSRSKSHKSRGDKTPLRKILKSKDRKQIQSPLQKIYNIIRQEEKQKQNYILNQRTFKHLNQRTFKHLDCYRTMNQLKQTNQKQAYPILKRVQSQKNAHQLGNLLWKKERNSPQISCYQQLKLKNQTKVDTLQSPQKKTVSKVKREESLSLNIKALSRQKQMISTQKIKNYFYQKKQKDKKHFKMKLILQEIKARNSTQQKANEVETYQIKSYNNSNLTKSLSISDSMVSTSKDYHQNQIYSGKKLNHLQSQSKSQNKKLSSMFQNSDYGFQLLQNPKKLSSNSKRLLKTPKKQIKISQFNSQPNLQKTGDIIDSIESFQSSKFDSNIQNWSETNKMKSKPSIQQKLNWEQKKSLLNSHLQTQKSVQDSEQCKIKTRNPFKSQMQSGCISVNTPAYRNKNDKKPKQSIICKLKKDIQENKLQSSKRSKLSSSKRLNKDSSLIKNIQLESYISGTKLSQQVNLKVKKIHDSDYTSQNNYEKNQSKASNQDQLSSLIRSPYYSQHQAGSNKSKGISLRKLGKIQDSKIKNSHFSGQDIDKQFSQLQSNESSSIKSSKISLKNIQSSSMINSRNKIQKNCQINSQKSVKSKKQQDEQNKSILHHQSKVQDVQGQKLLKFIKVRNQCISQRVQTHKMSDSNIKSSKLNNSFGAQLIVQGQSSHRQVKHQRYQKAVQIKKQEINEGQSQSYEQSEDSSSSISSRASSQKRLKSVSKKLTEKQSQYSQSSQSQPPTDKKALRISINQSDSKSSFSLTRIKDNNNDSVGSKTSIVNSSNKQVRNNVIRNDSLLFRKKRNFAQYTLNDVARYIEEHQFRIQAYCLYIDNCKVIYEQDYQLHKTELLSFLMLKKNLYQLKRAISALQDKGQNVFNLTDIQILDQVLKDYLDRQQIKQQLSNLIKQERQTRMQFEQVYESFQRKYQGERGFNLSLGKDDFSSQIVKKLGNQLNTLYQKWQRSKQAGNRATVKKMSLKYEKRMIQIIELIFLTSQLDGKKVKNCQLTSQLQQQFRAYYQKWFQRIIQTIEYFDSKSKLLSK